MTLQSYKCLYKRNVGHTDGSFRDGKCSSTHGSRKTQAYFYESQPSSAMYNKWLKVIYENSLESNLPNWRQRGWTIVKVSQTQNKLFLSYVPLSIFLHIWLQSWKQKQPRTVLRTAATDQAKDRNSKIF